MQKTIHTLPLALVLFIFACALGSCKKGNATVTPVNTTYFMSFKADGRPVAYTNQGALTYTNTTSSTSHVLTMSDTDATSRLYMHIESNYLPITAGFYQSCYPVNGGTNGTTAEYHDSTGAAYLTACGDSTFGVSATFTEISDTAVRGTFTGALRKASDNTRLYITDGNVLCGPCCSLIRHTLIGFTFLG